MSLKGPLLEASWVPPWHPCPLLGIFLLWIVLGSCQQLDRNIVCLLSEYRFVNKNKRNFALQPQITLYRYINDYKKLYKIIKNCTSWFQITLYRNIDDYKKLYKIIKDGAKSVVVVGSGLLGSELAAALAKDGSYMVDSPNKSRIEFLTRLRVTYFLWRSSQNLRPKIANLEYNFCHKKP